MRTACGSCGDFAGVSRYGWSSAITVPNVAPVFWAYSAAGTASAAKVSAERIAEDPNEATERSILSCTIP